MFATPHARPNRTPPARLLAAGLGLVLGLGALELHSGLPEHSSLTPPTEIAVDAVHGDAPAHLERSELVQIPRCPACALHTQSLADGLERTIGLTAPIPRRGPALAERAAPTAAPGRLGLSRAPPLS